LHVALELSIFVPIIQNPKEVILALRLIKENIHPNDLEGVLMAK